MPAPAAPAKTPAAPVAPTLKHYRCIIKTAKVKRRKSNGEEFEFDVPMAPFHFKTFGGKAFGVQTYRRVRNAEGEYENVPQRGCVEEFIVGGPACELERVKAAIRRKVIRWKNRDAGRGEILSLRNATRKMDPATGHPLNEWEELPNPHYIARPGDEPLINFVIIEEVVPDSDHGPIVPLE